MWFAVNCRKANLCTIVASVPRLGSGEDGPNMPLPGVSQTNNIDNEEGCWVGSRDTSGPKNPQKNFESEIPPPGKFLKLHRFMGIQAYLMNWPECDILVSRLPGLETFAHFLVVSVSVSKNLVSDIKSRYWYRKIWSRKKSLGIGIGKICLG